MKRTNPLSLAAVLIALVALVLSATGGAEAAAKIGKNLVVTKSIKDGAVTGEKVKDGSLTASDLAPGTIPTIPTIPAPGNGTFALLGSTAVLDDGPNAISGFPPSGPESGSGEEAALAPATMTVGGLHALADVQGPGRFLTISLLESPNSATVGTPVLTCVIQSGATRCDSTQTATVPAGYLFYFQVTAGSSGATGGFAFGSLTAHLQ